MKKQIACVVQARVGSGIAFGYQPGDHRVDKKVIRPFAETTLIEICLKTLLQCKTLTPDQIYLAVYEDELIQIGQRLGVKIYKRSFASICKGATDEELYKFVDDINAPYYMQISPCNPLMRSETIDRAITTFQDNDYRSLFGVVPKKNYFFDRNGTLVTPFLRDRSLIPTMDTKFIDTLYEAAHCIYLWNADRFRKEKTRWSFTKDDPFLFEVPADEAFDIDYPWQFDLAESMYLRRKEDYEVTQKS